MDANRRAELIKAVEEHGRDLFAEISELVDECDRLKAAIATPELYVGVVEKILAEERELAIADNLNLRTERDRLKAEVKDLRYSLEHIDGDERYAKLRAGLERLVAAANEAKGELEYDITNGSVAIDILKDAIAAAKDGCAPVQNKMLSERSLLKNAILFINNEWEKGTYSPEWFMEQVIVKIAVEKAKEVVPMDNR